MNYWLIKSEPTTYSWDNLVKLGRDHWDGVRNYAARNNMKSMKVGDLALFYHSVSEKAVVGIAKCVKEYYQDPTTNDSRWVVVDFESVANIPKLVKLNAIKANPKLTGMQLVKLPRLSVSAVTSDEFHEILRMGEFEGELQ